MDINSPLFDRVRIRSRAGEPEARSEDRPRCQHPGCTLYGDYRAPMGRNREGQYFRFCLAHVQEYNKTYNYFAGMSDDAVAAFQKDAITGHRPTWTIGAKRETARGGFWAERQAPAASVEQPRYGPVAMKALEQLGLDGTATPADIRQAYTAHIKRLHPDANGGDRSREEKLRAIIRAYKTLKTQGQA